MLEVADGVDRDVGGPQQIEHVAERERAAGVAAVGVEDEDLLAVLLGGAVEIDAERVVQRRHSRRPCARGCARSGAGSRLPRIARDADLGVEVDERDVLGADPAC